MPELAEPPPLLARPQPPPAARRVALGLLLYGGFDLLMGIMMLVGWPAANSGNVQINLLPGFVIYWIAAWLVWKDKRTIWPALAFLSAFALGGILGSALGLGLGLPDQLAGAFFRNQPFWFWFYSGYGLIVTIFAAWLFAESLATRPHWGGDVGYAWLQPKLFLVAGLILSTACTWGVLALLQSRWTDSLVARARGEYGADCQYLPIRYHSSSRNGQRTYDAVVLVYSKEKFRQATLHWTD